MLKLGVQERTFNVKPVGIKYLCEFCNDGEMVYRSKDPIVIEKNEDEPLLHQHICSKCSKIMFLPKIYPYIEWVPVDDKDVINNMEV